MMLGLLETTTRSPGQPVSRVLPLRARDVPLGWEVCACPLCGGQDYQHVVTAPAGVPGPVTHAPGSTRLSFRVVRCSGCGLCFTNPRPTPAGMAEFYPSGYRPHQSAGVRRASAPRPWHGPRKALPTFGGGKLLDFGCGNGSFLVRMRAQGWEVTGIDTSAAVVNRIRRLRGLRLLAGTLPHPDLEPETFDLITMWQALEHVHDPLAVLREARRLLVPGGMLLVSVPNLAGLSFSGFGGDWFALDLPRHLIHFTPGTLRRMLEVAGFYSGRMGMERHSSWLRASARLACRKSHAPAWKHWLRHKLPSRLAAWGFALIGRGDGIVVRATR
jgi:SAM-dependent methyltransferase